MVDADGIMHDSFASAARARGLLDNDTQWRKSLQDATLFSMPTSLRILFASICSVGAASDCLSLWLEFKEFLTEDYARRFTIEVSEQLALHDIRSIYNSTTSASFNLLQLPIDPAFNPSSILNNENDDVIHSRQLSESMVATLNQAQLHAYNTIMGAIQNPSSNNVFFIDGPGGSGKTYLYNTLLHSMKGRNISFLAVSWTGVAAMLLLEGKTSHVGFRLPLFIDESTTIKVKRNSKMWKKIYESKVIVWDEISLVGKHAFDAVDRLCRYVMGNDNPFGQKCVVVGGDFRQCLPIVPHGHRAAIVEQTVKFASAWSSIRHLPLSENMRASSASQEFRSWLLRLGQGSIPNPVPIPPSITCDLTDLIHFTFGDALSNGNFNSFCSSCILCPRNEETFEINRRILSYQTGTERCFFSYDQAENEAGTANALYPVEYLNSITPSGFPEHKLCIKIGSPVILLRNLSVDHKLANGTRLIVTHITNNLIIGLIIENGMLTQRQAFITRIDFVSNGHDTPIPFRRRQFPLRLAFAMTINKSQGQTLDRVGLYLRSPIFAHGQLYVVFSRVRELGKIRVCFDYKDQNQLSNTSIDNIVYTEIFDP